MVEVCSSADERSLNAFVGVASPIFGRRRFLRNQTLLARCSPSAMMDIHHVAVTGGWGCWPVTINGEGAMLLKCMQLVPKIKKCSGGKMA